MATVEQVLKPLGVRAPSSILGLLFDERSQIHPLVELIGFRTGVAYPAFGVELFCNLPRVSLWGQEITKGLDLHDPLTIHPEIHASELL